MANYYDVESYGAVADWGAGRTGTILPSSPDVLRVNSAVQLSIGQKIAIAGIAGTRTIVDVTPNKVIISPAVDFPDETPVTDAAFYTDNYDAFVAALAAMRADQNAVRQLVAKGWFYIGQTLTIAQTVHLEGVGDARADLHASKVGSRSNPGTWLLFPKNIDGIRLKSAFPADPGGPAQSAERTKLRNFSISCLDRTTTSGHGIFSTVTFDAECVTVENFGGNGFHLFGWVGSPVNPTGTPMLSSLWNCFTLNNHHGFHLEGTQCGSCRVLLCNAQGNRAVGFYDQAGAGGTAYAFCHANSNGVYNYQTVGAGCLATFFHCYNEGQLNCSFEGMPTVIGSNLTKGASPETSPVFEIVHGEASRRPFEYVNRRESNDRSVRSRLGEKVNRKRMSFLSFEILGPPGEHEKDYIETSELRYGGNAQPWLIWENDNTGQREYMRFPTILGNVRSPAPWFSNGIYLGLAPAEIPGIGGNAQVRITASRGLPAVQRTNTPLTYEVGDTVWEANPKGENAAWEVDPKRGGKRFARRCVAAGTLFTTAALGQGQVDNPGTLIFVILPNNLAVGQYISVERLDGGERKKITGIDKDERKVTYTPRNGTVGAADVSFATPEFETLYAANGPSVTTARDVTITADQRFVTVTASGIVVKLPNSPPEKIPFDGETHEIKGNGAFAVTIDGNKANIDGAADYTQPTNRSNTRVRFNGTSREWEIR
ncbi:hypothetical protein [Streptomyces sp. NPDC053079]|uniref:hypothetical protein n=1 Tax=Streptomyces sp. NPDC053079 TaxID=3365697 RepID=UPI0037D5196A